MNKNEFPEAVPNFRGYEIHPVAIIDLDWLTGEEIVETCDDEPDKADFWSVYGQLWRGGVECLADCPNKTVAEMVLFGLQATHNPKCPECGHRDSYVDNSDGAWRICNACGTSFQQELDKGNICGIMD